MTRSILRRAISGFTLIELLVVVAIIALLIAILLPSLALAKRQARQLLCSTNLRTQGEAAQFYSSDNDGYVLRGTICLASLSRIAPGCPGGAGIYATGLLKYLHPEGPRFSAVEQRRLWESGFPRMKLMHEAFSKVPQFQCPERVITDHNLHYISNAMPIPFRTENAAASQAGMQGDAGGSGQEGDPSRVYYDWAVKESKLASNSRPSELVFVTELSAKTYAAFPKSWMPLYSLHAFYLGNQLPFAAFPRIANDQRHPRGIVALHFDGHVAPYGIKRLDPGWPKRLGIRMRYFSPLAADVPEQFR